MSETTVRLLALIVLFLIGVWLIGAGPAEPPYRRADWPHWLKVGDACADGRQRRDARQQVLFREHQIRGEFAGPGLEMAEDGCTVEAGQWFDVYGGGVLTDPVGIHVDHLVALSWAHRHGGARWSREQKAAYANFLGYRWHLVPSSARLNIEKSDKGPDEWVPPNPSIACQYGEAWATVLILWNLRVDAATRDAIRALVSQC